MSVQFTIRPATYKDIKHILEVNQAAWDVSYQGCIPDDILKERHKTFDTRVQKWQQRWHEKIGFVAEINGQIVGEATGSLEGKTANCDCQLHTLYVHPDYQGFGIGKALFLQFTNDMKNHGERKLEIHTMYRGVPDKNGYAKSGPSIGFYQKMGCCLTEIYDNHPLGMIDVLMIREL